MVVRALSNKEKEKIENILLVGGRWTVMFLYLVPNKCVTYHLASIFMLGKIAGRADRILDKTAPFCRLGWQAEHRYIHTKAQNLYLVLLGRTVTYVTI